MSTTVAINTALMAQSNAANAQAQEAARQANIERCKTEILVYDSKSASTQQMKSYAQCVQTVFPDPVTRNDIVAIKASIVYLLVCMIIGGIVGRRDNYTGFVLGSMGGLLVGIVLAIIVVAILFCFVG